MAGLYASPTVVNNVETIASVPSIIDRGAAWFASMGTEKSKGMTIYSLSGHVKRPGQFEAPLLVAPAMNHRMWRHPATQSNVATLLARGVRVVGPNDGPLAEGESGPGRMAEPAEIVAALGALA